VQSFYSIAEKVSALKAAAMVAADETTDMNATITITMVCGQRSAVSGGVKWRRRALHPHRRTVLFLLRRNLIYFERSKNNIDLH